MTFPRLQDRRVAFAVLFLLALGMRVWFVYQWQATPYGAIPLLDAHNYDSWAQAIASGHLERDRAFYQSPLYPYMLGGLYSLVGHSFLIAGFINAVLGAATVVVLGEITWACFGSAAAWITGLLAAFYRPFIFYTPPLMKEPLGLFLLALFLWLALRIIRQNSWRDYALSGITLGLAVLVRGNLLLLAPVIIVAAAIIWRRAAVKNILIFLAALALGIFPATLHNFIVSHDFVPVSYDDGFNLYIGNSDTANGTNAYPPEVSTDPLQEELNTTWIAEQKAGHALRPSQVAAYWRNRAFDYILQHPRRDFELLANKLRAFWNGSESFDNYDISFIHKNFATLLNAPLVPFWLVSCLAAFGVAATGQGRRPVLLLAAMALAYMASVLLFYITDRYCLPVVVFLLPLAGAAMPEGMRLVRAKNGRRLGICTVSALTFLFLAVIPPPNPIDLTAFDWGTLSTIYQNLGRDSEGLEALHKGIAISPRDVGSQPFIRGAIMEQNLGDQAEATRLFDQAMELFPQDGVLWYNQGQRKAAQGDIPGALAAFQKAESLAPSYTLTYYALAKVYGRLGDNQSAIAAARRGLAIDPADERLQETLTQLQSP